MVSGNRNQICKEESRKDRQYSKMSSQESFRWFPLTESYYTVNKTPRVYNVTSITIPYVKQSLFLNIFSTQFKRLPAELPASVPESKCYQFVSLRPGCFLLLPLRKHVDLEQETSWYLCASDEAVLLHTTDWKKWRTLLKIHPRLAKRKAL